MSALSKLIKLNRIGFGKDVIDIDVISSGYCLVTYIICVTNLFVCKLIHVDICRLQKLRIVETHVSLMHVIVFKDFLQMYSILRIREIVKKSIMAWYYI